MNATAESQDDRAFQRNMMSSFIQIIALVILVSYCLVIIGPFAGIVVWGIILAVALYPMHVRLTALVRGREKWSAAIIVIIGLIVVIGPGWVVATSSIGTARHVTEGVRDGTLTLPAPSESVQSWPVIGDELYAVWSEGVEGIRKFASQYHEQVKRVTERFLRTAASLLLGLLHFVASIIIAGACLLYAKGGYELALAIGNRVSPGRGDHLANLSIATIRSVTVGVLGVAMIQSALAGIGFAMIGVPAAGLLTVIVLVTAIVQIPALLVMAPVAIWVFSFADPVPATIFAVYAAIVGLSDNVLKPILLGRGVDLPTLIVLIGAIGGMVRFGVIGLFIGAVILGLGYRIISDWIWPADNAA
jgi:predicted PurR-regulated permease PerM